MCCFKKKGKIHNSDTQPQLITNLLAATPLSGAAPLLSSLFIILLENKKNNTVIHLSKQHCNSTLSCISHPKQLKNNTSVSCLV